MSVRKMKQLNRPASSILMRREAEAMDENGEEDLGMQQMPVFTEVEPEEELLRMGPEDDNQGHAGAGFEGA